MDRDLDVHLDLQGATIFIGRLHARARGAKESCTFEYRPEWLDHREAFALDPMLPLQSGPFHRVGLFNAFTDPAPDRWGRNLLPRRERRTPSKEGRPPRTLLDADFLTMVDDPPRLDAGPGRVHRFFPDREIGARSRNQMP